jgi:hypothetical protein
MTIKFAVSKTAPSSVKDVDTSHGILMDAAIPIIATMNTRFDRVINLHINKQYARCVNSHATCINLNKKDIGYRPNIPKVINANIVEIIHNDKRINGGSYCSGICTYFSIRLSVEESVKLIKNINSADIHHSFFTVLNP